MSIAVTVELFISLESEIARHPDPVPISNILNYFYLYYLYYFKTSSIIISDSGLGSKTSELTKNSYFQKYFFNYF